jgi:hypothetical protein
MNSLQMQTEIGEIWNLFRETNRQMKEMAQETDKKFKELVEAGKETDKKFREMSATMIQTGKMVGNLGNRWGEFVEGMVKPGMLRMFKDRNINIAQVYERCVSHKEKHQVMEIDLLGVNGPYVVAVEVKSRLTLKKVKDFMKKLAKFKDFFPSYSDKELIGAVAGITIISNVRSFVDDNGLFLIGQAGDAVSILNDQGFEPKLW